VHYAHKRLIGPFLMILVSLRGYAHNVADQWQEQGWD
jgi:hypothetical protein